MIMPINSETKKQICTYLQKMLSEKAEMAIQAIESAKESRNKDTKSSAGDKYETGRAMMQIEIEKNEVQLSKAMNLQKEISKIDLIKKYSEVEFGSLLQTNHGLYFISIGLGKIVVDSENYFAISLASPIGLVLRGKTIGDEVPFQGRNYIIQDIS